MRRRVLSVICDGLGVLAAAGSDTVDTVVRRGSGFSYPSIHRYQAAGGALLVLPTPLSDCMRPPAGRGTGMPACPLPKRSEQENEEKGLEQASHGRSEGNWAVGFRARLRKYELHGHGPNLDPQHGLRVFFKEQERMCCPAAIARCQVFCGTRCFVYLYYLFPGGQDAIYLYNMQQSHKSHESSSPPAPAPAWVQQ